jgi:hypothetical protein
MASNWHSAKADGGSNALVDVPSELKPLKLCIFKRLQLSAVNSHCSHMRSRHSDLVAKDEENETTLAGTQPPPPHQFSGINNYKTKLNAPQRSTCAAGYSDDEQGPKHAFAGQRVSDRTNAVNTSMNSVSLSTGHAISTLLGLETYALGAAAACVST